VPLVDQHLDGDEAKLDADHAREQDAPRPAVPGAKVRKGEAPDGAERRKKASHGMLLSWAGLPGPFNKNRSLAAATSRPSDAWGVIPEPEQGCVRSSDGATAERSRNPGEAIPRSRGAARRSIRATGFFQTKRAASPRPFRIASNWPQ